MSDVQFGPKGMPLAASGECLDITRTTFTSAEVLKEDRPRADRLVIHCMLRKDHRSACSANSGADAVDIGNNSAGHRHFHHLPLAHEAVLQIDDDMRSLTRD